MGSSVEPAAATHLDLSAHDHVLTAREHVAQECLVEPRHANRRRTVVDHRVEYLATRTPGGPQAAAEHPARDGGDAAGLQRCNRLQAAPVFVPDGKAVQQIFEGDESGVFEVRGAARPDPLQKLKGRREHLVRRVH